MVVSELITIVCQQIHSLCSAQVNMRLQHLAKLSVQNAHVVLLKPYLAVVEGRVHMSHTSRKHTVHFYANITVHFHS